MNSETENPDDWDDSNDPYLDTRSPEFQRLRLETELLVLEMTKRDLANEERAKLEMVVFALQDTLETHTSENAESFTDMLARNTHTLDRAFDYYLRNAHLAADGDRKIGLAFRAHGQMVSAINTWQRLRSFKNDETK